jgi:hypothetical protein
VLIFFPHHQVKTASELYDRIDELQDMRPIVFELLSSLRSSPNTAEGIRVWREYITNLDEKRTGKAVARSDTPDSSETPKAPQVSEAATNTVDTATDAVPTLYGGFMTELEQLLAKYSDEFDDPPEPSVEDVEFDPPHIVPQNIIKTALQSIIWAAESMGRLKEDLPNRAQPAVDNLSVAINTAMGALTTQMLHMSKAAQGAADMAERAANTTRDINTKELEAVKDKFVNLATGVGHVAAQVAQQVGRDVHSNVIENLDSVKKQVWEELARTKEEFKTTRETFMDALSGISSQAIPPETTAAEDTTTKWTKTEDTIVETPVETVVGEKSEVNRQPTLQDDDEEAIYIVPARKPRTIPALTTPKDRRESASSNDTEDSLYSTPKPSTLEWLAKKRSVEAISNTSDKEPVGTEVKPDVAQDAPTTDLNSGLAFFGDLPASGRHTADWVNNLHQNNPGKPPSVSSTAVSAEAERSETFWTQMAKISDMEKANGIPPPLPPKPESLANSGEYAAYTARTLPGPSHRVSMYEIRPQNPHLVYGSIITLSNFAKANHHYSYKDPWSKAEAPHDLHNPISHLPPTLPLGYPTPRHTSVTANQYAPPRDLRRPHSIIGLGTRPPRNLTYSRYAPYCSDEEEEERKSDSPSNLAPTKNKNRPIPRYIDPAFLTRDKVQEIEEIGRVSDPGIKAYQVDMEVEKRRFEKERLQRQIESMKLGREIMANERADMVDQEIRERAEKIKEEVRKKHEQEAKEMAARRQQKARELYQKLEKEARERAERLEQEAQKREQEAKERAEKLQQEAQRREQEARERAQQLEQEAQRREQEARERAERLEQEARERAQQLEQEAQKREQEARERAQQLEQAAKERTQKLQQQNQERIKAEQERQQRMAQGDMMGRRRLWIPTRGYEEKARELQKQEQDRTGAFDPSIASPLSFLSDLISPPRVPSQDLPGFGNSQGPYHDDDHAFANQMAQAMFESTAHQQMRDTQMDAIDLCIVHLVDMGYAETHGMEAIQFHANVAGGNLEKAIEQIEGNED